VPGPFTTSRSLSAQQLLPLLVILVMVVIANVLPRFQVMEAAGADSSGYLNEARLIAQRRLEVPQPAPPGLPSGLAPAWAFVPLGFRPTAAGRMVPTYPIGLPFLISLTPPLPGWDSAPGPVICLHALLGLLLMYILGRQFALSHGSSLLAVLILAASPLFLLGSEQALSDVPALTWCAGAVSFALAARRRRAWGVAAGLALSVAVAIRPTDLLVLAPIAVALGTTGWAWAALALGALPGLAGLGLVQRELYGSAFATGYGNIGPLFSARYLLPTLGEYAWALPVLLTPAVLLAAALPWTARGAGRRTVLLMLTWIGAFAGFYACYYCTHEAWWYLRFLLPAFPPLIIGALAVGEALLRRRGSSLSPRAALIAGVGAVVWGAVGTAELRVLSIPQADRSYPAAVHWMKGHLPPRAIVAAMQASGSVYHESAFPVLRYDQLAGGRPAAAAFAAIAQALPGGATSLYALLAPFEVRPALEQAMPGHWSLVEVIGDWTLWHLEDLAPTPLADRSPRVLTRLVSAAGQVEALVGDSWYGIETSPGETRVWSRGDSVVEVIAAPATTRTLRLRVGMDSRGPVRVRVTQDGKELWAGTVRPATPAFPIPFTLRDGRATLRFVTDAAGVAEPAADGGRQLKFALLNPQLVAE